MAELITWNIYTSDGRYEGQAAAFVPETAFAQLKSLSGDEVSESDIEDIPVKGDEHKIIYNSEEFHLMPAP